MTERTVPPATTYILTWVALSVLLGLNIASSFYELGGFNGIVNVLLSAFMTFLIIAVLMNVRLHSPIIKLVSVAGFLWLMFQITLTLNDYLTRASIHPPW